MVNTQLTRKDPVFWVVKKPVVDPAVQEFQVKKGFYMYTIESDNKVQHVVSPLVSGLIVKPIDAEYVFLTEEEATACAEALTAAAAENN